MHDHNLYFYTSSEKKHKLLFSNLKAGLDKGCSTLYIASGESIDNVKVEMKDFGLKVREPEKLRIVTSHQWYTLNGEFNADGVVKQYSSLIEESLDKGFEGLFISADVADTFNYLSGNLDPWLKYESSFSRGFKLEMEAICAYPVDQVESKSKVLLQLIQSHRNTITSKTETLIDNRKLCLDIISQELDDLFGEHMSKYIFNLVERDFKLPKRRIPDRIEQFNRVLESLFGHTISMILRERILRTLTEELEF